MRAQPLIPVLVAAALVGCRRGQPSTGLPDTLAAVVATPDGQLLSVLVELPRPGVEPIIRLAPGAVALDQGWARAWLAVPGADGRTQVHVVDLASQRERVEDLPGPVRLLSMSRDEVVARTAEGVVRLETGVLRPMAPRRGAILPGGNPSHAGPGGGFAARIDNGNLELQLPREDATWTPVLVQVDRLIGCWWIDRSALPPWERRVLDDRFKHVGVLRPEHGEVQVDGDLGEWRGVRSVSVDNPSQILLGQRAWQGERDAGLGVAARWDGPDRLVLAVRVRDDHFLSDQDMLIIRDDDRELRVPMRIGIHPGGPGWFAAVGRRSAFERTVEAAVEDPPMTANGLPALVVQYVDADPGETSTLLSTAPWPAAIAQGSLAVPPPGPARPAPQ